MDIYTVQHQSELEEREQRIERLMRHAWFETGLEWGVIRDKDLYFRKEGYRNWDDYCQVRWTRDSAGVDRQIARAREISEMVQICTIPEDKLPSTMSHATELAKLETVQQRAEVWQRVIALNAPITAKVVEAEVVRYKAELDRDFITLEEWSAMSKSDQLHALNMSSSKQFNATNDNVEWARWTWNPITGCLHGCDYCYARDIAARFFPQKFETSMYPNRIRAPKNTQPTKEYGGDKVFVCSMADLFGKWVPQEWIEAVINQAVLNPQWTFLFLSKFPVRMAEFTYPDNVWLGTTVDRQYAVQRAESAFRKIKASGFKGVCWLSCEPMLERLTFSSMNMFDWAVIGGASKSTQTPEYHPPFDDIVYLYQQARQSGCKVYMKTNLIPGMADDQRIREYPG